MSEVLSPLGTVPEQELVAGSGETDKQIPELVKVLLIREDVERLLMGFEMLGSEGQGHPGQESVFVAGPFGGQQFFHGARISPEKQIMLQNKQEEKGKEREKKNL